MIHRVSGFPSFCPTSSRKVSRLRSALSLRVVVLAIDHGFLRKLLTAIFGGIAICLGSFVIAALIAIMTFVKRLAAKRQAEAGK